MLDDIYDRGVLADDPALYLHHPTVTDPSMAPPGCSTFYALAPVPHLGKADGRLGQGGRALCRGHARHDRGAADPRHPQPDPDELPLYAGRLPVDLFAHLGIAFSLEPVLWQSAWFRTHNRDDVIRNLYFVGAGTHPGAGIPGVVGSAEATAGLMLA